MGRPLNKKYFGNTNDSGLGGEGLASVTVTGISTLRYIKAFNDSEQAQSYTSGGARLYDMKIYNGVTSAGNEWKELGT